MPTDMTTTIADTFRPENAAATAALFNVYLERRRLAGLPERLNRDDVLKIALLLHHSTPPSPMQMPDIDAPAGPAQTAGPVPFTLPAQHRFYAEQPEGGRDGE
jgi:hypothetical protein